MIIEDYKMIANEEHHEFCNMNYRVTMSDGSKWDIPLWMIIYNRAEYYAGVDSITIEESINEDTIPLFKSDSDEVQEWATNNMNWEDVDGWAELVESRQDLDYQHEWVNPTKAEVG